MTVLKKEKHRAIDQLNSLPDLLRWRAEQTGERAAYFRKTGDQWEPYTWNRLREIGYKIAHALIDSGLQPGDRVTLLSENRPEWVAAHIGVMMAGGITVPLYITNTPDNHRYILESSGATRAIVSNQKLLQGFIEPAQVALISNIIVFDAISAEMKVPGQGMAIDFLAQLPTPSSEEQAIVDGRTADITKSECACIIYTSGTSGNPSGVMLSHLNILTQCSALVPVLESLDTYEEGKERWLSFLPMSHSYEHMAGVFIPIAMDAEVYTLGTLDNLLSMIKEVQPTLMTAVPRLYETIRGRILQGLKARPARKQALFHRAIGIGVARIEGKSISLGDKLFDMTLARVVRKNVSKNFGGRLKAFVSGGAPLNYDVAKFFNAMGIRILQGYGQTESAPVISVNVPNRERNETVGPKLDGVEVKIAEDGEILTRSDCVMIGYWQDQEKTAKTIIDGWLYTGDIGVIEPDGFLMITDRKKDIIVNSGGDNIAPQRVEGILLLEPEIAQCLVFGDRKPHLTAAIWPDPDFVSEYCKQKGLSADAPETFWESSEFHAALHEAVKRANGTMNIIERVRKFILVDEAFSIENGMLTPSLKTRRIPILALYGEKLENLYS